MKRTNMIIGSLLLLSAVFIGQNSISQTRDDVEKTQRDAQADSQQELLLLYTKTNEDMAAIELQRVLQINKTKQYISSQVVERLRSSYEVAKEQHRQAQLNTGEMTSNVRKRHAEEKLRLSKSDLAAATQLHGKNLVSDLAFKQAKLRYDLARLNLALINSPNGEYAPMLDTMQNQIDHLGLEIISLEQRVSRLESHHGS